MTENHEYNGGMDKPDEKHPDPPGREDYFGYPEGAELIYYDDEGNEISGDEWLERVKRKAEEMRRRQRRLGRRGGLKGGPARAAKMPPEERSAIAKKAANARWAKRRQQEEAS